MKAPLYKGKNFATCDGYLFHQEDLSVIEAVRFAWWKEKPKKKVGAGR